MKDHLATDMHFHSSSRSDGRRTLEELESDLGPTIEEFNGNIIAVLTDHNSATKKMLGETYFTCAGVEVSTFDSKHQTYAHLLLYAQDFSSLVDETLSGVRQAQMRNVGKNIEQLHKHGFEVSTEEFAKFFSKKGYNPRNLNNFQLARYVMSNYKNRSLAGGSQLLDREIENSVDGYVDFMKGFLRYNSEYSEYGYSEDKVTVGIEPIELAEISTRENGIISFAHPQVTCRNKIDAFPEIFKRYHEDYGVNAIEIPAVADDQRIEIIIKLAKEYNCLLTFGSDSHGYPADIDHGDLMKVNRHIKRSLHQEHAHEFREMFCESQTFAQAL